jgi:antitoxin HicB
MNGAGHVAPVPDDPSRVREDLPEAAGGLMAKKHAFDLDSYPFVVRRLPDEEGGGYLIEYPDVPHCLADGQTPEEAIRHGREALEACLVTIAEFGKRVPQPGSRGNSGQWRQRVPKSLHARLVERAEHEGVSLNTLVTALIAEGMGKKKARGR